MHDVYTARLLQITNKRRGFQTRKNHLVYPAATAAAAQTYATFRAASFCLLEWFALRIFIGSVVLYITSLSEKKKK